MPGNLLSTDISFPSFSGKQSSDEKIEVILNYLYMLREQLRYTLGNLDAGNFNDTGLSEIGDTFTEPVYAKIEDTDGNVAELSATAEGLSSSITNAEGNISALYQTSNSLTSRISSAEGSITTLTQTVNGFELVAENGSASSTLSLKAGSTVLSSTLILFSGMVTFSSMNNALSGNGTTSINGGNIMTETISASRVFPNASAGRVGFDAGILFTQSGGGQIAGLSALFFGSDTENITKTGTALYINAYDGVHIGGIKTMYQPGVPNKLNIFFQGNYVGYIPLSQ